MALSKVEQIPLPTELLSKIDIKALETVDQLPQAVEKRSFFFVTEQIFENIRTTRYQYAFRCSELEVELINEILKCGGDTNGGDLADLTANDFFFEDDIKCQRCHRQINFYDVFRQGIEKHGVDFMKWAISKPQKVQMFPAETVQSFNCSACKHSMVKRGSYSHYFAGGYACV